MSHESSLMWKPISHVKAHVKAHITCESPYPLWKPTCAHITCECSCEPSSHGLHMWYEHSSHGLILHVKAHIPCESPCEGSYHIWKPISLVKAHMCSHHMWVLMWMLILHEHSHEAHIMRMYSRLPASVAAQRRSHITYEYGMSH